MAADIKLLRIERFRGIRELVWRPALGLNLLLGGGNVGKTTLLEAIGLLLSPTTSYTLVDSDYFGRQVEDEFVIEATMSMPGEVNRQLGMAWPWEWDGQDAVLADAAAQENAGSTRPPVYKARVRGTADLELVYEIVQPDETVTTFSVGLRREIGLVRLLGDDRNDRDLRLVQGSNLDRLLNDRGLRARLGREFAADAVDQHLENEPRNRLEVLGREFQARRLPSQLGLAFTGSAGLSINSLIGLTADKDGVVLPLATWGSGTRRLGALAIADTLQDGHPITLVDELERGLEPYRQRQLVKHIIKRPGQAFVTTHSASVLSGAAPASVWYVDTGGQVGALPKEKIARHLARDPEAFLARLTIVAEGATEVGFLEALLDRELPGWRDRGVYVADGGGNDDALTLLEALSTGGVKFAGFVDNENRNQGRWGAVKQRVGARLFQWRTGCLEENVIPMFAPDQVQALITDPTDNRTGLRLRTLADRLETTSTSFESLTERALEHAGASDELTRNAHPLTPWIIQAATGSVPEALRDEPPAQRNPFKAHASAWFKSIEGGRELAAKVRAMDVWENQLDELLRPFLDAVVQAQGEPVPTEEEARNK
ncbi:ATP-binding protein [Burkholderia cenocepacia]|jgi:putative ATP-dependent endonuclease of OLD family|uniref:ATP-dependent nuclease n=1 Tax=Burkholderia cenocepacia TaxID=95486 RepID=UPI0004F8B25A|nr:ATP-binding protein [Burkholderia cenocepacia]AIO43926.1 AAA domain protein [Burkholderia cepacia]KGC05036.1 AAA domain protein [Burkholderia cepacia]MCG0576786.1 ATP-binding protein [Burkholderia cenocepacia]MCW3527508.1 ATP-binding protein [Burkholderia cenocepacia]MCW3617520.1 ATP-binding protein [Burkholderia cenocepacia]